MARILDDAIRIPGTNQRIGLDALIGLLPVGGDLAGALLAGSAILFAQRAGAPTSVLVRMAGNVAIDALVGSVPLLGDVFDVAFRAKSRNATLLEEWLGTPVKAERASKAVVIGLVLLLLLIIAGAVALSLALFRLLANLLQS